jgi:hypothetical protein
MSAIGAVAPLIVALLLPETRIVPILAGSTALDLAVLADLGASASGADLSLGAVRVTRWGALARGATVAEGKDFGVAVG